MKAKSKSELKLRQAGDFVKHATESADPASRWLWSSNAWIVFAPDFISELVWKRISVEFFSEIGHKIGQKLTNTILTIWDITLKVVLRALSTGLCLPFLSPHDKWLNQIIRSNIGHNNTWNIEKSREIALHFTSKTKIFREKNC